MTGLAQGQLTDGLLNSLAGRDRFSPRLTNEQRGEIALAVNKMDASEQDALLQSQIALDTDNTDRLDIIRMIAVYGGVEQRIAALAALEKMDAEAEANFLKAGLAEAALPMTASAQEQFAAMSAKTKAENIYNDVHDRYAMARDNSWDMWADLPDETFRQAFIQMWYGHGAYGVADPNNSGKWLTGSLSGAGWAMMHNYISQVGPNADAPYHPDFWAKGIIPPPLNPKVLARFQRIYEETQKTLENEPDEKEYYRVTRQPAGLAAESWTESTSFAQTWGKDADATYSGGEFPKEFRREIIPKKNIFMAWHTIDRLVNDYEDAGESEMTVLGSAFYNKLFPKYASERAVATSNTSYLY
jgi:hypothetical protein